LLGVAECVFVRCTYEENFKLTYERSGMGAGSGITGSRQARTC